MLVGELTTSTSTPASSPLFLLLGVRTGPAGAPKYAEQGGELNIFLYQNPAGDTFQYNVFEITIGGRASNFNHRASTVDAATSVDSCEKQISSKQEIYSFLKKVVGHQNKL